MATRYLNVDHFAEGYNTVKARIRRSPVASVAEGIERVEAFACNHTVTTTADKQWVLGAQTAAREWFEETFDKLVDIRWDCASVVERLTEGP